MEKLYITLGVHIDFEVHSKEDGTIKMFFVDHNGYMTFVPHPTQLKVLENGEFEVSPTGDMYILSINKDYDIMVNNNLFYKLTAPQQHVVNGPLSFAAIQLLMQVQEIDVLLASSSCQYLQRRSC